MKRFLLELAMFLSLFIGVDFVLGKAFRYGEAHAIGEKTIRNYYINNKTTEDILIFGSSRAMNHYNPQILEDSLGLTVYNCGEDETGVLCFYPKLNLIKKRYFPKAIIYDVYTPDLLDGLRYQNGDYLETLKTSYGQTDAVDSMFTRYEPSSKYKLSSTLYQYNSTFLNVLLDNIRRTKWFDRGFYLLNTGVIEKESIVDNSHHDYIYDAEKLCFLEKFIFENRDSIQLFFAISPEYGKKNDELFDPVKIMCEKYGIPLLNHYCDTMFSLHKEYFGNPNHLNQRGALLYTSIISEEIKCSIDR